MTTSEGNMIEQVKEVVFDAACYGIVLLFCVGLFFL